MKETLKKILTNDISWKIICFFGLNAVGKLRQIREWTLYQRRENEVALVLKTRIESVGMKVQKGPFAGMRYPSFQSVGSTLFPKLLGTYESELFSTIEQLLGKPLPIILDVGCAEGYYAVGLTLGFPKSKVFAFDTDATARQLCRELGHVNLVSDRLTVLEECNPAALLEYDFSAGGLLLSDCEGYEKTLFRQSTAFHLRNAHVLIETHDYINRGIIAYLEEVFAATHEFIAIKSIADQQKVEEYESELVGKADRFERLVAFSEGRREIMEWAFFSPKR